MAKQNGITNPELLNEIADTSTNFRDVYNSVVEYRATVLEQLSKPEAAEPELV